MESSLLLVTIAGENAAINTDVVRSVVELDTVTQVPRLPAHVKGLSALRSRAMTVIDCRCALDLLPTEEHREDDEASLAVVVEIDDFLYALMVDQVADVIAFDQDAETVRTALDRGWARVSRGMVHTPSGPAQLIDPAPLIAGAEPVRAP